MREVFFNSFKEKILNGQVPSVFDVSGTPMASDFINIYDNSVIKLEQYKNLSDFDKYSTGNDNKPFEETKFKYDEYCVEYSAYYDNDVSEKPMFVNPDNWDKFLQTYSGEIGYSDPYVKSKFDSYISNDVNVNSGFYYIQKKSQLKWISERCNDRENFNNRIVVVMGDDIGSPAENYQLLDTVICNDPNRPFQGILDFNGHRISNLVIECNENSNGIVGYLGADGVVRDAIVNNILFKCSNKISLDKIRTDCSDVVVGGVVGTNYGTVENIVTSGDIRFNGFCPEVYLASNKYEYQSYDNVIGNTSYNCFFSSKFCINSLYNVIPYVGYFAEGADSYFNDVGSPLFKLTIQDDDTHNEKLYQLYQNNLRALLGLQVNDDNVNVNGKLPLMFNLDHFTEYKLGNNDFLDLRTARLTDYLGSSVVMKMENVPGLHRYRDNVAFCDSFTTTPAGYGSYNNFPVMFSLEDDQNLPEFALNNSISSLESLPSWNDYQEMKVGKDSNEEMWAGTPNSNMWEYGAYLARQLRDTILFTAKSSRNEQVTIHQKMNPYSRIAYYCSTVVGNNFGLIRNIDCRHTLHETNDTFVGFIGSVCGKQNCGIIDTVNSLLDVVPLSESEVSASPLASRVYTDNRSYIPDYPDSYTNLVNVFGYNWDYYQTSAGLNVTEQSHYATVSASAAYVSDRFYSFHDFLTSGVQVKNAGDYWVPKNDSYVFNELAEKRTEASATQKYCNFKLNGYEDATASAIGSSIPDAIRNAKLKLSFVPSTSAIPADTLNTFAIEARVKVDTASDRSTFKLYNPYEDSKEDNIFNALSFDTTELEQKITNLNLSIEHMDLNVIGDAAKTLSRKDPLTFEIEDREDEITLSDALSYCSAFNGECGSTVDNAMEFATNIMNAKVAVGCEMLGNPALNVDYSFPGGVQPFSGANEGLFGCANEHNQSEYVIPSGVGPNNTDENWVIDVGDDFADFCWYMQPGEYKADTEDGPEAFEISVWDNVDPNNPLGYIGTLYHFPGDRPNYFSSINVSGLWDVYGGRNGRPVFEKDQNCYQSDLPRTMLTIVPKEDEALKEFGEYIASVAHDKSGFQDIVGDSYSVKINKISIPLFNRTQNRAYQSSSLEGVSNVSGVYLDYNAQPRLWDFKRDEQGRKINPVEVESNPEESALEGRLGNLDDMYIDMSILVSDHEHQSYDSPNHYRVYPMIAKIPLRRLRIPISAIEVVDSFTGMVQKYSEDLANIIGPMKYNARSVKYYHLLPAYDMQDRSNENVKYDLKSIYNVGGICGMINHAASFIERGMMDLYYKQEPRSDENGGPYNRASCGQISNCNVKLTRNTFNFINRLLLDKMENGKLVEFNDRTIGVANKFGGIAAVYEYRQNDIGTSPYTQVDGCGPDSLTRLDQQRFLFQNITVAGYEDFYTGHAPTDEEYRSRSLFKIFTKIFSPFVEWANVGNILDTTNMWLIDDKIRSEDDNYRSRHSSNFPISSNIHQAWTTHLSDGYFCGQNEGSSWIIGMHHPVVAYNRIDPTQEEADLPDRMGKVTAEDMGVVGCNIGFDTTSDYYPRLQFNTKTYDLLPSVLLNHVDVWYYGDSPIVDSKVMHMSPVANAPCSEYNDIYMQMFGGNPNFINRKLGKPIMRSLLHDTNHTYTYDITRGDRVNSMALINQWVLRAYSDRYAKNHGITDRYFTWDYDMRNVDALNRSKTPMDFTIRYGIDRSGTRGLWIHQIDGYSDVRPWTKYAMKGKSECMNDGSCIRLGYMPSDWSIIELMNRSDEDDSVPDKQYDEGRAIDGTDFRGILLSEPNGDLVAFIDTESSIDLVSGCYIASLPRIETFDGERYGLLTEIATEE